MTLPEQLGQLLIVGIDRDRWGPATADFLRSTRPGGVIFFQRNITTAPQFRELVEGAQSFLDTPPFLALDLEGGLVDRLREVLAPLPAVRDVAVVAMGETLGRIAGREVAAFSLNVDFAPVLDLATPQSLGVMGSRTAGASPDDVVGFARNFLKGLGEQGIIGCGKHFPGLGSGQTDSHKELPTVEKDGQRMWEEDLLPFRALARELPMIMIAHVYCPGLESAFPSAKTKESERLPASLSHGIVTGLLKERINFQGLVVCDDLEMGGVLEDRSMEQAAIAALKAGCDILLLCGATANTQRVFDALLREANSDSGFRGLVETAAEKVALAKKTLGIAKRAASVQEPDFAALRKEIEDFSAVVRRKLEAKAMATPFPVAAGIVSSAITEEKGPRD
jgi:beta-N-acetylhexosaminidase